VAHQRAKLASLTRSRTPDDPDLLAAKRNLREANLAEHIAKTVAEWPELEPDQLERLALQLRGGEVA
jgi:hypothetical protein